MDLPQPTAVEVYLIHHLTHLWTVKSTVVPFSGPCLEDWIS